MSILTKERSKATVCAVPSEREFERNDLTQQNPKRTVLILIRLVKPIKKVQP